MSVYSSFIYKRGKRGNNPDVFQGIIFKQTVTYPYKEWNSGSNNNLDESQGNDAKWINIPIFIFLLILI